MMRACVRACVRVYKAQGAVNSLHGPGCSASTKDVRSKLNNAIRRGSP